MRNGWIVTEPALSTSGRSRSPEQHAAVEGLAGGGRLVRRTARRDAEGEQPVGVEAGVEAVETGQAAQHQTRPDQQHEREGHLERHETAAQTAAHRVGRGARRRDAQALVEPAAQQVAERRHGQQDGDQQREARHERHDRQIELEAEARELRAPRQQPIDAAKRERDRGEAERAAEAGQHEALREQLPQQRRGAGAERPPHRDLALALDRTRERDVADVGERHQHQERHGPEQQQHGLARLAREALGDRHDDAGRVLVALGILAQQPALHGRHVLPRLAPGSHRT